MGVVRRARKGGGGGEREVEERKTACASETLMVTVDPACLIRASLRP